MILVTLGTQDKSFERLLKMMDEVLELLNSDEEVIVQAGFTKYQSNRMQIFDYIDMDKFNDLLAKCDVLVTHGGVGTMITALKMNKKIIACSRLSKFHEHHNDHQQEIIDSFSEKGYILACSDVDELLESFNKVDNFIPEMFTSNHEQFLTMLREEIAN